MDRLFANNPGSWGSIPMTQKIVLDASLFNTQHYKVWIKGKWNNPGKEKHSSLYLGVAATEKGAFGLLLTMVS